MTKSFNKFKKSIFPIFGGKKFLQIIRLSRTNCQNLGKLIIQFQEIDETNGRADGRMDRKTDIPYFIRSFWLPTGVQK